jgi:hypothetical protein
MDGLFRQATWVWQERIIRRVRRCGVWPAREHGEGGPSIYSGFLGGNNEPMTGEKR